MEKEEYTAEDLKSIIKEFNIGVKRFLEKNPKCNVQVQLGGNYYNFWNGNSNLMQGEEQKIGIRISEVVEY